MLRASPSSDLSPSDPFCSTLSSDSSTEPLNGPSKFNPSAGRLSVRMTDSLSVSQAVCRTVSPSPSSSRLRLARLRTVLAVFMCGASCQYASAAGRGTVRCGSSGRRLRRVRQTRPAPLPEMVVPAAHRLLVTALLAASAARLVSGEWGAQVLDNNGRTIAMSCGRIRSAKTFIFHSHHAWPTRVVFS